MTKSENRPIEALTILVYHYVRPVAGSRYPLIRGLEVTDFQGQLDYIERYYQVVSIADVIGAVRGQRSLPERPLLLTFDDGYTDHHRYVWPALRRRGMTGAFFPSSSAVSDRRMLDVNKIQFVLASVTDHAGLATEIEALVESSRDEFVLLRLDEYRRICTTPDPYDVPEVVFIKRMLQHALPEPLRRRIASQLFRKHVSTDELAFAEELYVSEDDLREMIAGGMEVGGHGGMHHWLDRLSKEDQAADIDQSLAMLTRIGVSRVGFCYSYPYGAYNGDTLDLMRARGCAIAFTSAVGLARPQTDSLLELPRLDTNDLPCVAEASPADWTLAAGATVPLGGASPRRV